MSELVSISLYLLIEVFLLYILYIFLKDFKKEDISRIRRQIENWINKYKACLAGLIMLSVGLTLGVSDEIFETGVLGASCYNWPLRLGCLNVQMSWNLAFLFIGLEAVSLFLLSLWEPPKDVLAF